MFSRYLRGLGHNLPPSVLARRLGSKHGQHRITLRSIHSWRLYENLKRWESTGKWIVDIDEFHQVMESSKSYQENFAQLRKWVIEPAVKELREVNGLDIDCLPQKTGRKVTRLVFIFEPAAQMQMDF